MRGQLDSAVLDEIRLMVSEMVSVAVARPSVTGQQLTLELKVDGVVRCELVDDSRVPSLAPALEDEWSLSLMDQLTRSWGLGRYDHGTHVWFEAHGG